MFTPTLVLLAVDLAIVVLVVEAVLLLALRARHRLPLRDVALIALAGLGLLAALRAALAGAPGFVVLAGLTLGGASHALDLAQRLRRAANEPQKR
jgi:hypothetical protein